MKMEKVNAKNKDEDEKIESMNIDFWILSYQN